MVKQGGESKEIQKNIRKEMGVLNFCFEHDLQHGRKSFMLLFS